MLKYKSAEKKTEIQKSINVKKYKCRNVKSYKSRNAET